MRMKRKTTFRLAAATLAMTQLVTAAASAAFTNGFSWSYPVGEGLTYTLTECKNTAGVQRDSVDNHAVDHDNSHDSGENGVLYFVFGHKNSS